MQCAVRMTRVLTSREVAAVSELLDGVMRSSIETGLHEQCVWLINACGTCSSWVRILLIKCMDVCLRFSLPSICDGCTRRRFEYIRS
jgi:hypothetical protein